MNYIGIDVGLTGSISIISQNFLDVNILKMPTIEINDSAYKNWYDISKLKEIFSKYENSSVVLEYQRPMPGQDVASIFRLGRGFGVLESLINVYYTKISIVDPKKWQNYLTKKYLTNSEQIILNNKDPLTYLELANNINSPERFIKLCNAKNPKISKIKSYYIYKKLNYGQLTIPELTDHNLVDSLLISYYCKDLYSTSVFKL